MKSSATNHAKRGRVKEKQAAKRLGAKTTPASGATWASKGDFELDRFLVDNKATQAKSFGLSVDIWTKLSHQATVRGKYPMLTVQIALPRNNRFGVNELRLVVLEESVLQQILSGEKI